jgi:hypothetical protein
MCMKAHGKVFGVWSREEIINKEILSRTPSSKCVTFVQVDLWGNERNKNNQHGVELALLSFARQPINPTHLWSTGGVVSNIGFGRSACYLSMLTISLKPSITRNPNHLLPGTSLGIYEERKIYKWRWERRLQSGLGEFTPFGRKVKTFSWGEEDRLEEGLLVPAKKNKREGL